MFSLRWLASLAVLVVLGCASLCGAQPVPEPTGALELQAGRTCLTREPLLSLIRDGLGESVAEAGVQLVVEGSEDDPRTATLRLFRDGEFVSERTFSPGPPHCGDFLSALAVAATMMIKAAAPAAPLGMVRSPEAPAAPAPESPEIAPAQPQPAPPMEPVRAAPPTVLIRTSEQPPSHAARHQSGLRTWASGLLGFGVAASRGGGLDLGLGAAFTRYLSWQAGFVGLFSARQNLANAGGSYSAQLLSGSFELCAGPPWKGSVWFAACVGTWAGRWHGEGSAFSTSRSTGTGWLSAVAALELAIPFSERAFARVRAMLVAHPGEIRVVARDPSGAIVAHADVPNLGAVLGIGLEYAFSRQGGRD